MNTTNSYREQLLARKAELSARIEAVEDLLDDPKSKSFSEQATEREFDEVYEAQGMAGEQELHAIEAALNRIANGSYGRCLSCGESISAERLTAVPFATKCRKCMQQSLSTIPIQEPVVALHIGDTVPDFTIATTKGEISFHRWVGNFDVGLDRQKRANPPESQLFCSDGIVYESCALS